MRGRPYLLIAISAVALLILAPTASATHVQCGDTITQDTTLDSDIQCGPTQEHGIIISASNVTLWMAGHKITASAAGADTGHGITTDFQDQPFSNVEVRRGTVEGFQRGVVFGANDSAVMKVAVTEGYFGINLFGDRNYAHRNTVDLPPHPGPFGNQNGEAILLMGDDAYAWGNAVTGAPNNGIVAQGERPRLVLNQVGGCGYGSGVHVDLYTTSAVVNQNTVGPDCYQPIAAYSQENNTGGAKVRLNRVTGGWHGMYIVDPKAVVGRNVVTGASHDGIHIARAGTTVQNNTANNNGGYGIFAPVGAIDGGGNTAAGNGDGTTPQCVNVQCGSP